MSRRLPLQICDQATRFFVLSPAFESMKNRMAIKLKQTGAIVHRDVLCYSGLSTSYQDRPHPTSILGTRSVSALVEVSDAALEI